METAEAERRVILTCDRVFVRARHSDFTYFVQAERKQEQLEEVRPCHGAWLTPTVCLVQVLMRTMHSGLSQHRPAMHMCGMLIASRPVVLVMQCHVITCVQRRITGRDPEAAPKTAVQVFREFDINVEESSLLSRCSKCNGEFINRCDHPVNCDCSPVQNQHTVLPPICT